MVATGFSLTMSIPRFAAAIEASALREYGRHILTMIDFFGVEHVAIVVIQAGVCGECGVRFDFGEGVVGMSFGTGDELCAGDVRDAVEYHVLMSVAADLCDFEWHGVLAPVVEFWNDGF